MSSPIRGRALIINNHLFMDPEMNRKGSDVDVKNMTRMLKEFKFEISETTVGRHNLSAEVRLLQYCSN